VVSLPRVGFRAELLAALVFWLLSLAFLGGMVEGNWVGVPNERFVFEQTNFQNLWTR